MKKVTLVYFDAGGGHRASMLALRSVIEAQQRPWQLTALNLQELLDSVDPFLKLTKIRLQDVYNRMIQRGMTLGTPALLKGLHGLVRLFHGPTVRVLEKYWRETQPEMVVSLVPNFNRQLWQSLRAALPAVPYVTVITDIADYPPHFWIERQAQWVVCPSERAVEQGIELGHPPERLLRVSGVILNPRFYEPVTVNRAAERARLGLDASLPTGLVMFGGHGSGAMVEICKRLGAARLPLQLIAICGHNQKLAARLRAHAAGSRIKVFVEGFTKEVPYYMALSDFFIGKPGPGSICEALQMGLPVIVERNTWTLPQERYNCDWILEKQVGVVLPNFRGIAAAVAQMIEPAALARFRANAAAIQNRAVFEIPDKLAQILET
jgi:1,2-diacylglycerol 3-beta-galactosyltransferase